VSTIIFVVLVRLLVAATGAIVRTSRAPKPKPLCTECVFAHVQYGACGRRVISCTFGGGVRPLKIDVLYCNDYRSRYVPARTAIVRCTNSEKDVKRS
jgi:hypothetical protein